jgi:hypothetical protein
MKPTDEVEFVETLMRIPSFHCDAEPTVFTGMRRLCEHSPENAATHTRCIFMKRFLC